MVGEAKCLRFLVLDVYVLNTVFINVKPNIYVAESKCKIS